MDKNIIIGLFEKRFGNADFSADEHTEALKVQCFEGFQAGIEAMEEYFNIKIIDGKPCFIGVDYANGKDWTLDDKEKENGYF